MNNPLDPNKKTVLKEPQPASDVHKPGTVIEIPPEGSLGVLALGAVGIKAWRAVREGNSLEGGDDHSVDQQKQNYPN